jgi:hypothetical protein
VIGPLVGKRAYWNSNTIIYSLEKPGNYPGLISRLVAPINNGKLTIVTSSITLTEVLTHPIKAGDTLLEGVYRKFISHPSSFRSCRWTHAYRKGRPCFVPVSVFVGRILSMLMIVR